MKEIKYNLKGLDCANCAMKIEKALNEMEIVENATVNFATLKCNVTYKNYLKENENQVMNEIVRIEDEVNVNKIGKTPYEQETHEHHEHEESCGCGHEHHEHEESCECGHEHHEHEEGCGCDHEHASSTRPQTGKYKWNLSGLDCANCALKIEDKLNTMNGIKNASLNFTTGTLLFDLDQGIDEKTITKQMKDMILILESDVLINEDNQTSKKSSNDAYKKLIPILSGAAILIVASMMNESQSTLSLVLYLISYLIVGYPVLKKATKNILRGEVFDENFLMSIATIGAIVTGEYPEAVFVMIFYAVGEMFQSFAVGKSRDSIASLMNIKSEVAHLWENGNQRDVHPETIAINDMIIIKPGERIPLDGEVIEGNSSIDTSALTGESIPTEVEVGKSVMAGCVNLNGLLKVKVSKPYGESTVSRILELVENASSKKAQTEQKITRFARVYTPIVVFLAIAIAIIPQFFNTGLTWDVWLLRACTFLVISCPCALVLSVPLGYFAGIGAASKAGVLVKGGNYLEVLNKLDTIVFDKTGTLTSGTFAVSEIVAANGNTNEVLELAAIGESFSTHPIGQSIVKAYGKNIDKNSMSNLEEIAGYGIRGFINKDDLVIGNARLMEKFKIDVHPTNLIGTIVHVAKNGQWLGAIAISDTIKENTKQALADLKAIGIRKTIMLTGDRQEAADHVANAVGIDEVHAQLLPTDKVSEIEKILADQRNGKVAFVGDGINDAPVLARCDLGIAMGGIGSEAAIEAADIIIMRDNLDAIADAIRIAKKTQSILNQNIAFVLFIKFLFLILAGFGIANMWMGVFADVGVSVLAIINSMRILRRR